MATGQFLVPEAGAATRKCQTDRSENKERPEYQFSGMASSPAVVAWLANSDLPGL